MPDINIIDGASVEVSPPGEGASAQAARAAATRAQAAATQTDGDAQAVETARQQVEGIDAALPGRVTAELAGQVPPAVAEQVATQVDPKVAAAEASRVAADLSAQNAASSALVVGSFTTFALADAAKGSLDEGHSYEVTGPALSPDIGIWTKRSGVLVQTSTVTVQGVASRVTATEGLISSSADAASVVFKDAVGNVTGELTGDGGTLILAGLTTSKLATGETRLTRDDGTAVVDLMPDGGVKFGGLTYYASSATDYVIGVVDAVGNIGAFPGDPSAASASGSTSFSAGEIAAFDAQYMAYGQTLNRSRKLLTQLLGDTALNAINSYGQSFSAQGDGSPPLSTTASSNNAMLGGKVRFNDPVGNGSLAPFTDGNLHDLVAVTQEGYQVAAVNGLRRLDLAAQGQPSSYTGRRLVTNVMGYPGTTIEQLSHGAAPVSGRVVNYWDNMVQVLTAQKAAASALGQPFVLPAILMDQGQANVTGGTAHTAEDYCAALLQIVADFDTYITGPLLGQEYSPLWVINQTGGRYQADTYNLGVSQGQILAAQRDRRVVLAGNLFGNRQSHSLVTASPGAPYPDVTPNAHPTVNAHRAGGCKLAQVLSEVLIEGRGWDYMRPLGVLWRGTEVLICMCPRKGPIRFASPFYGYTRVLASAYPAKGFAARDSLGSITITAVDIVGVGTVRVTLGRTPSDAPYISGGVAAGGNNGLTFIEDSDDANEQSQFGVYTWIDGGSQEIGENVAGELGNPYPMNNQLAAFFQRANAA